MLDGIVLSVEEIIEANKIIASIDSLLEICSKKRECKYCEQSKKTSKDIFSVYSCVDALNIKKETGKFMKKVGIKDSELEAAIAYVHVGALNCECYGIIGSLENLKEKLKFWISWLNPSN